MEIQNQVSTVKVVSISYEDYLQYCRDKFGIVEAADGIDEIQTIIEAVSMNAPHVLEDRAIQQLKIRAEVTVNLVKMYRDAANYLELLQAHIELKEKEKRQKEQREHAEATIGH